MNQQLIFDALVEGASHEQTLSEKVGDIETKLATVCKRIAEACGSLDEFVNNLEQIHTQHKEQLILNGKFFRTEEEQYAYVTKRDILTGQPNSKELLLLRRAAQKRIFDAWRRLRQGVLKQMQLLGYPNVPNDVGKRRQPDETEDLVCVFTIEYDKVMGGRQDFVQEKNGKRFKIVIEDV